MLLEPTLSRENVQSHNLGVAPAGGSMTKEELDRILDPVRARHPEEFGLVGDSQWMGGACYPFAWAVRQFLREREEPARLLEVTGQAHVLVAHLDLRIDGRGVVDASDYPAALTPVDGPAEAAWETGVIWPNRDRDRQRVLDAINASAP